MPDKYKSPPILSGSSDLVKISSPTNYNSIKIDNSCNLISNSERVIDLRFQLLKVLGSMGVVIVHATAERVSSVNTDQLGWWLASIFNAVGRYGSATFVMVGGAVLLAQSSEQQPLGFVKKRLGRLVPILLFWSAFYFLWRQLTWGNITPAIIAQDLLLGIPWYHLWFIYMLLGLYLMIPALRLLIRDPRHRKLQYYALALCAILTCIEAAAQTLQQTVHASFLGLSPLFIAYLIGGYLLYRDRPLVPVIALWLLPLTCIFAMVSLAAILYPHMGRSAFTLVYSNRAPFAMLLTSCLFLAVLRMPRDHPMVHLATPLGSLTLGIYAIHPFWIDIIKAQGLHVTASSSGWIFLAVAVYILSALSAFIMSRVPGLRHVVR